MAKESASSQINEPGSPPLSARLRNIVDEMRSFCPARPLPMNVPPISETPSSSIDFVPSIVVQMTKESASSQINEPGSPPLSARLRSLIDEMKSFCPARPLSTNLPPISETPSSSIGFVEYQTPLQKEHIVGTDGRDTSVFNSPWDRFSSRNKGVQNSFVEDYLKFLNTANKEELMKLKGIGDKRATAIIEFRDAFPEPFKSVDDLQEIGLSEKQIKGMLKKEMRGLFN